MTGVRWSVAFALVVAACLLGACATGGPAGTGARIRCTDDRFGDQPGMRPLVFLFCVQSP